MSLIFGVPGCSRLRVVVRLEWVVEGEETRRRRWDRRTDKGFVLSVKPPTKNETNLARKKKEETEVRILRTLREWGLQTHRG